MAADAIDELVERVTVDAYGDYEQLSETWQCFEDEARFPFPATWSVQIGLARAGQ